MEPYVRCGCCVDQHSEVRALTLTAGWQRADESLTRVHSLLNDPNTGSPANVEASNLYKDNRKEYTKRVRETVEKSWED